MISTTGKAICTGCGREVDEQHIVWQNKGGGLLHFHMTCALFMAKGLLNNVYELMRMRRISKEGNENVPNE